MRDGMRRLREDGLHKVMLGRTSLAEVARVTGTTLGRMRGADARAVGRDVALRGAARVVPASGAARPPPSSR